ncbi:toll-like receptor 6 [Crotalus adamanteus]|uniref:Toll-like receptor 6 n=1 Tax=Crotalus adamanteus TaxID=8729 RepID=A0AAW1BB28_CROAD
MSGGGGSLPGKEKEKRATSFCSEKQASPERSDTRVRTSEGRQARAGFFKPWRNRRIQNKNSGRSFPPSKNDAQLREASTLPSLWLEGKSVVAFLCIRFDIPWYFKMIWGWSQVKRRIWKNKSEDISENIQYHAFVSYSEHDAHWVKTELISNLEKENGSLKICQHERDFIAGKSIVENIIDSIEKSYKSIFVLSPNFVQSEWCHYELYFAHHKLFSENADGLILILLEPIPAYLIPAKYYKLKALMAKRTYLEWPKDKRKHAFFWTNLRAALQIKLPNPEEMNEL